ncbi:hypothetical protein B0T11DRAFT_282669 [Plectosphaerella cucumerina]|uniref:Uncharacterized protein n=1 Tax=Plectosphaerella cucumerina TaxID=40658 RepID=A0A8K0TGD0_9PEZI|nr:hypothetical protein B0T11DRAFT_282669 [Plectosphaerella cucumerina]
MRRHATFFAGCLSFARLICGPRKWRQDNAWQGTRAPSGGFWSERRAEGERRAQVKEPRIDRRGPCFARRTPHPRGLRPGDGRRACFDVFHGLAPTPWASQVRPPPPRLRPADPAQQIEAGHDFNGPRDGGGATASSKTRSCAADDIALVGEPTKVQGPSRALAGFWRAFRTLRGFRGPCQWAPIERPLLRALPRQLERPLSRSCPAAAPLPP